MVELLQTAGLDLEIFIVSTFRINILVRVLDRACLVWWRLMGNIAVSSSSFMPEVEVVRVLVFLSLGYFLVVLAAFDRGELKVIWWKLALCLLGDPISLFEIRCALLNKHLAYVYGFLFLSGDKLLWLLFYRVFWSQCVSILTRSRSLLFLLELGDLDVVFRLNHLVQIGLKLEQPLLVFAESFQFLLWFIFWIFLVRSFFG